MPSEETTGGPIMRLFEVQVKPGCAQKLLESFATTSAAVVKDEPGNRGYFFGQCVETDEDTVIFASLWRDLDAVKARFGADWRVSFLPPGYEALIESCRVRHFDLSAGWRPEQTAPAQAT